MKQRLREFWIVLILVLLTSLNEAKAHDLLCKDWLNGEIDSTDSDRSLDEQGIKGVCRDYFPTWGEREKIERTNTDPFEVQYQITRQYCWFRFFLDGSCNCGGPRVTEWLLFIPIGFSWDPPNYTVWGDTKSATVSTAETISCSDNDDKVLINGFHSVRFCSFPPNTTFKHGGTNDTKRTKVCGYYVPWFLSGIVGRGDWANNLIGCVDAPIKAGPPTFNKIIVAGVEPFVDTSLTAQQLVTMGSTFDQPLVRLVNITSAGTSTSGQAEQKELLLRYKFPGDTTDKGDGIKECSIFPGIPAVQYCAKVPPDRPDKVCVCDKPQCDNNVFLGCAPRPTPKQSDIAIVAEYMKDEDEMGKLHPALNVFFAKTRADGSVISRDSDGNEVYEEGGQKFKLDSAGKQTKTPAKEPISYERLPLPPVSKPLKIREYYTQDLANPITQKVTKTLTRGVGEVYGLDFVTLIPKFTAEGDIEKIKVYTMQARKDDDGCAMFTEGPLTSENPEYMLPAGKRDISACCSDSIPDSEKLQKCTIPPHPNTCPGGTPPIGKPAGLAPAQDKKAESAICPGAYRGAEDASSPDKLCLFSQSIWQEAMPDPVCVSLPSDCDEVTTPSQESGLAVWPAAKTGETQIGTCDIGYGVAEAEIISLEPLDTSSLDTAQAIEAEKEEQEVKTQLSLLLAQAQKENRNIQAGELPKVKYVKFKKSSTPPQRTCHGSVFSTIQNACVYAEGCLAVAKPAPINGNATWPDSRDIYTGNVATTSLAGNNSGKTYQDKQMVESQCVSPYASLPGSESPKRQCMTDYKIENKTPVLVKQVWGGWQNACMKSDDSTSSE